MRPHVAVLLLLTAGCAGTPEVAEDWFEEIAPPQGRPTTADFPGAVAVLSGFDEAAEADDFRAGDRALYGLEFREGDRVRRWTMLLEVVEPTVREDGEPLIMLRNRKLTPKDGPPSDLPFVSEILRLRVTRLGATPDETETTRIDVPRRSLSLGLARGCAEFEGWSSETPGLSHPEMVAAADTFAACTTLFEVIQEDEMLADVLWQIARAPSAWSLLTHAGVVPTIHMDLHRATRSDSGLPGAGETWRLPLRVEANDEPALLIVATVSEPRSPWNVGAGVLSLSARRPGDDRVRLDVLLLAARRGSGT